MIHPCIKFLALALLVLGNSIEAKEPPASAIIRYDTIHHPVVARNGMVVSQNNLATEVGLDVLKDGGNAVDAAVAVGFALAVTLPRAGNIGGGGFMLISNSTGKDNMAIDYREKAPAAAHRDLFVDQNGLVDKQLEQLSHQSAGVPGTVAGLALAWREKGSLPWRRLIEPAIRLAEEGFVVSRDLSSIIEQRRSRLDKNPASKRKFFSPDGRALQPGQRFLQPELAWSLTQIAEHGPQAFYQGDIAEVLVDEMTKHQGIITREDLAQYQPTVRKALQGTFGAYQLLAMPPPSSGGVHILQMLGMIRHLPLADSGQNSAQTIHYLTEVLKRAYADRSKYLGDPDFVEVPTDWLTSEEYTQALAASISPSQATSSEKIRPGMNTHVESPDTTHFSVVDRDGNAVANTYTLNFSFGSGITVEGAGFLLNNEMADFSAKPGVPNAFGLLGGEANAIQPGKRPLSSMSPMLVFKDDSLFLVTGSPGGSRIISTVFQQLVNLLQFENSVVEATHYPRIHHQWSPDVLELEPGFSPDTIAILRNMGHTVKSPAPTMGSLQTILRENGLLQGAADPRRPNALAAGF